MKLMIPLALFLFAGLIQADEQKESWVLILTPTDQPATYVPGFTSEKTCEIARQKWWDKQKGLSHTAVCVKQ